MILTGIGDEGGNLLKSQIQATKELGWRYLEMRGVEVPGFKKANLHDLRRYELAACARIDRESARSQMGFRHGEPDFQSRPFQAQAVAQARPMGILDACPRSCRPHPRQRCHVEYGQERCRLQLARRR